VLKWNGELEIKLKILTPRKTNERRNCGAKSGIHSHQGPIQFKFYIDRCWYS